MLSNKLQFIDGRVLLQPHLGHSTCMMRNEASRSCIGPRPRIAIAGFLIARADQQIASSEILFRR
jgi:hypothetical protein